MENKPACHFNTPALISARISQIIEHELSMPWSEFWQYIDRVYLHLKKMQPNTKIVVSQWSAPEKRELFTLVVKLYLTEGHDPMVRFNEDYTEIKKLSNGNI
jgi:hypothetical protein